MKCVLLFLCSFFIALTSFAQQDDKRNSWIPYLFYGAYYSPIEGDELNSLVFESGLGEFDWAPFGFANSVTARKKNHNIIYGIDITFKRKSSNSYKNSTLNIDVPLSYGYTVFQSERIDITPYLGLKGQFKGYWINSDDDIALSQYLANAPRDYNFFSMQLSGIIGAQFIYKVKSGKPLLMLSTEYSFLKDDTYYFRYAAGLEGSAKVENLFTIRIGLRLK